MKKILVCGDRNWTAVAVIKKMLQRCKDRYGDFTLIQGECKGADLAAKAVARKLCLNTMDFPAEWENFDLPGARIRTRPDGTRYVANAGPLRNIKMLGQHPDLVIAFHDDIKNSRGTRDMIAIAMKAGVQCVVVRSDHDIDTVPLPVFHEVKNAEWRRDH